MSGDRYHSVTTSGEYDRTGAPNGRAKPKSAIFNWPWREMSRFCGFKSRCSTISVAIRHTLQQLIQERFYHFSLSFAIIIISRSRGPLRSSSFQVTWIPRHCWSLHSCPETFFQIRVQELENERQFFGECKMSSNSTMFGWCSSLSKEISRTAEQEFLHFHRLNGFALKRQSRLFPYSSPYKQFHTYLTNWKNELMFIKL